MSEIADKTFWDSNLWIYITVDSQNDDDKIKKQVLTKLFLSTDRIVISSQVLNEIVNVMLRKFKKTEEEAKIVIKKIIEQSTIIELKPEHSLVALDLKKSYNFSWFDSLIVAAALDSNCNILYSEDMQNGLIIKDRLKIINPLL